MSADDDKASAGLFRVMPPMLILGFATVGLVVGMVNYFVTVRELSEFKFSEGTRAAALEKEIEILRQVQDNERVSRREFDAGIETRKNIEAFLQKQIDEMKAPRK